MQVEYARPAGITANVAAVGLKYARSYNILKCSHAVGATLAFCISDPIRAFLKNIFLQM